MRTTVGCEQTAREITRFVELGLAALRLPQRVVGLPGRDGQRGAPPLVRRWRPSSATRSSPRSRSATSCRCRWGGSSTNNAFWTVYATTLALTVAECFFAQSGAFVFLVYLVGAHGRVARPRGPGRPCSRSPRSGRSLPRVVRPWHDGIDLEPGALTILLVSFAMVGFFHIVQSNRELAAARAGGRPPGGRERALAHRPRPARPARPLADDDHREGRLARRLAERGERERSLHRDQRGRAAVAGARSATSAPPWPATARSPSPASWPPPARCCARPASTAEVPGSVDVVDAGAVGGVRLGGARGGHEHGPPLARRELPHQRAARAGSRSPTTGRGGVPGAGNGLSGLRERLAALDGTLTRQWRIRRLHAAGRGAGR